MAAMPLASGERTRAQGIWMLWPGVRVAPLGRPLNPVRSVGAIDCALATLLAVSPGFTV